MNVLGRGMLQIKSGYFGLVERETNLLVCKIDNTSCSGPGISDESVGLGSCGPKSVRSFAAFQWWASLVRRYGCRYVCGAGVCIWHGCSEAVHLKTRKGISSFIINAINVFKGDAKTVASSKKVEGANKCHDWDGGGGTFVPYLGDG